MTDVPENTVTFAVSRESNSSKASLSGTMVNWEAGDKIAILTQRITDDSLTDASGTGLSEVSTSESGPTASFSGAVITGSTGTYKNYLFAFWPSVKGLYLRYKETDASASGSPKRLNYFYCPMGCNQFGVKDDFSICAASDSRFHNAKSAAMYGVAMADTYSDTLKIQMKNAYALIKFRIEGSDVTQVDFRIGDNEIVATNCSVRPTEEPFNWSSYSVKPWSGLDNSSTLRVIPESGKTTFEPGTYYVSCAPVSGIPTVYVHKNGLIAKLVGTRSVDFKRSTITPLGCVNAIDNIVGTYGPIEDETISLDFSGSCPFSGFPTSATSGKKTYTYEGNKFIFNASGSSNYYYDTEKGLVLDVKTSNYVSISCPEIEGKRISRISVTAKSSAAGTSFNLGTNSGAANSYITDSFASANTVTTVSCDCPYTTPYSTWYLKPRNKTAVYTVSKIVLTYSQN